MERVELVVNREGGPIFSPIATLAIIQELCNRVLNDFYDNPGHPDMSNIQKIADTAVVNYKCGPLKR